MKRRSMPVIAEEDRKQKSERTMQMMNRQQSRTPPPAPPGATDCFTRPAISLFHGFQIECAVGEIAEQRDIAALVDDRSGADSSDGRQRLEARGSLRDLPAEGPTETEVAEYYRATLFAADARGLESVALPALTTRVFRLPFIKGTQIACRAIMETILQLRSLNRIRLVFSSVKSARIACNVLSELIRELSRESHTLRAVAGGAA